MEHFLSDSTQPGFRQAMDRFLNTVVRYRCVDREARVSYWRVGQAVYDRLYQEGLETRQVHWTGSTYEGMPREVCSDLDVMYIHKTYPVVVLEPPGERQQHQSGFVVAHSNLDQPAYLRLKVTNMEGISGKIRKVTDPNNFVSSELFVASCMPDAGVIHGPASTGPAYPSHPHEGEVDKVYCFHNPSWPPCTSEFLCRPRPHGWPSQSLIDKIQQAGCHVVGVGHSHSDNKDIEWRWSFSVAEKELIHNIDETMYGCMYVLKAAMKTFWKCKYNTYETQSNPFPSYFLKTACLWNCESNSQHDTVRTCHVVIDWLVSCYGIRVLPHYFIPEQNLIGHLSEDMCKKVYDWLVCVRDDLCRIILSSVTMDGHLPAVIDDMCRQLQVPPLSPDCDYRELVSTLCVHDRAREVLDKATEKIKSRCKDWKRYCMGYWSSVGLDVRCQVNRIHFNPRYSAAQLIAGPETILLPIIDNIHSVVKAGYGDMFRQSLYRNMGDCYHILFARLSNADTTLSKKAVHYYTLGREMVHPDGWSDKGLGGYVLLAKLYYLSGQWTHLEESLCILTPLLEKAKNTWESINSESYINITNRYDITMVLWKADTDMYSLISTWDDLEVYLHPVPLGYYILARFALRQGDREGATRALHNVEGCVDKVINLDTDKFTRCLIGMLKKAIC